MASESSFDIVSNINPQEVDNAINQAKKEIANRYDFRGSSCQIEYDKKDNCLMLSADNKMRFEALVDIAKGKLAARNVSLKSLKFETIEENISGQVKQKINFIMGIDKEYAKKIVQSIKDLKLKVNTQIQDEQVRVTSKSKDELQNVIHMVQTKDWDIPLQFTNYR